MPKKAKGARKVGSSKPKGRSRDRGASPAGADAPSEIGGHPVVGETGDKAAWIVETPEGARHIVK